MDYHIECNPTYSAVEIALQAGESIVSEAGAMAWMTSNMQTKTSTRGGVMAGLKRALLTKESFFQNTYTPQGDSGSVTFAPGSSGDIVAMELNNEELFLEKGAYLASGEGVNCNSKWDGLKGIFNQGMFVLRVTGTGPLFFHSYGRIEEIDVDGEYVTDNGYAVAWEPSLSYTLTRAKKIRSFLFADQLLLKFSGRGRVWVQSRSARVLANWAHPFRPVQRDND
ncbi:hypothetical protein Pan258_59230 [Symmachiella dynata]|uniref:TIGR00266 family protein n=1 Tax=Symmachiella dynata TaxID=2527995 RepID=UPI00118C5D11|nr:TIGR00266 family protein [Symmachiella dynata]QDT51830.1 hypothetical protein Pan258_59230 [Symmachiella dynata]